MKLEILDIARLAGFGGADLSGKAVEFERFAKMIEKKKQDEIDTLHALYEQACSQRDMLMDQQRAHIEALRGKLQ